MCGVTNSENSGGDTNCVQADFHYYATYCAAFLAGYSHEEALTICYSDQFVDCCTKTFLKSVKASVHAATSQTQAELLDMNTDLIGLQDITRIWASFHFLPRDLNAATPRASRDYRNKYRLICGPNGALLKDTVDLASGRSLQHIGIAMHVLADTWAHQNFAGTPSLAINSTDNHFSELMPDGTMRPIFFKHAPGASDDLEKSRYNSTVFNTSENSILNLGHGHAGHLPDYSFIRYKYMPAWDNYRECLKDNPADYYKAFCQMIYAMRCLRSSQDFELNTYDEETVRPYLYSIRTIITKRQPDASSDWKDLAYELTGQLVPDFDVERYAEEYRSAAPEAKDDTFLGRFILASLAQKSMITNKIFKSGNLLAGFSVDYDKHGAAGIRDYLKLVSSNRRTGT